MFKKLKCERVDMFEFGGRCRYIIVISNKTKIMRLF